MSVAAQSGLPKVLVVDDSRMVRATIVKHVKDKFAVREEGDGEAGWQALLVDPDIKIVLSDIEMPLLDGYGFLDRIRSSKIARMNSLPVIILSGDEDEEARQRAFLGGANDFVIKGINSDDLLQRLEQLLHSNPDSVLPILEEVEEIPPTLMQPDSPEEMPPVKEEAVQQTTSTNVNGHRPMPEPPSQATTTAVETKMPFPEEEQPDSGSSSEPAESNESTKGMEQDLAALKPFHPEISVMVIEIDQYGKLIGKYGKQVAGLVSNHLLSVLLSRVRQEDTVSLLAPSRFVVLSQSAEIMDSYAFALRLWNALSNLAMTYRDDKIKVKVTIGVANSITDSLDSISDLISVALARVRTGAKAGGDRVMGDGIEVTQAVVSSHVRQSISIDKALSRVRAGADTEVRECLPEVVAILNPLLELIESQLGIGLPLDKLKKYNKKAK